MSRYITNAGAFYPYVANGIGKSTGTAVSFLTLLAYNSIQIAVHGFGVRDGQRDRGGRDRGGESGAGTGAALRAQRAASGHGFREHRVRPVPDQPVRLPAQLPQRHRAVFLRARPGRTPARTAEP